LFALGAATYRRAEFTGFLFRLDGRYTAGMGIKRRERKPPRLVRVGISLPLDWHARIMERKGKTQPLSDFLRREIIGPQLDDDPSRPLSKPPKIGRPSI